MPRSMRLLQLASFLLVLFGCRMEPEEYNPPFFFDFESDAELNEVRWECHQSLTLSSDFVTHGDSSLKIELYPSNPDPGLKLVDFDVNWSAYHSLQFDLFNPQSASLDLRVLIDDQDYHVGPVDRFETHLTLPPGASHHLIPFDSLRTSGSGRRLDLTSIEKVYWLLPQIETKTTLYFDYLHLQ